MPERVPYNEREGGSNGINKTHPFVPWLPLAFASPLDDGVSVNATQVQVIGRTQKPNDTFVHVKKELPKGVFNGLVGTSGVLLVA